MLLRSPGGTAILARPVKGRNLTLSEHDLQNFQVDGTVGDPEILTGWQDRGVTSIEPRLVASFAVQPQGAFEHKDEEQRALVTAEPGIGGPGGAGHADARKAAGRGIDSGVARLEAGEPPGAPDGIGSLMITGQFAVARVIPNGETESRYTAIRMGDVSDFRNFMGAVIDPSSFKKQKSAIAQAWNSSSRSRGSPSRRVITR